jgi:glycosyltransferase involved in cell wall biosynthesis
VEERDDPPRLLVAGRGDHQDQLRALTDRLGLQDRVRFLGFVSVEDKIDLFRRSWIHVLTSPKEGWGIANMEAAACGTPTVASDAPGLRESVVAGRTGLLVPHADVEALAGALGRLLDDGELREKMGHEARAFAEGFSWDASADGMERLLHRVVASTGAD